MASRRKWAIAGVAVLAFFAIAFVIASHQDRDALESRRHPHKTAADRLRESSYFSNNSEMRLFTTEGTEQQGLVIGRCNDAWLREFLADELNLLELQRDEFEWVRCFEGKRVTVER